MRHHTKTWIAAALVCAGTITAAHAEIAVVVSAKSPLASLTNEQLSALFLGESGTLPDGSRAVLTDQGVPDFRERFYQAAAGRSVAQMKAIWARVTFTGKGVPPKQLKDAAELKSFLAGEPHGLGYLDASDVDGSVKAVLTLK